jgi:cytoskeleton protein RodZ
MTPPDADVTELPASPGARLRREREARGLTEQQAAETLNLDQTVVTFLESNDFAALGAPVFVKGHLRRYAAMLGLPEDEVVGAYERSKSQVAEPTLVPKSRLEMMPVRGRARWPWVVGGAVAFLLAAILAAYVSKNGLPGVGTADEDSTESEAAPPSTVSEPGMQAPAPRADAPMQQPSPATEATAGSTGSAAAGGVGAPPPFASASTPPAAAPPAPGQVSLQLRFATDSWVEIFDGSGKAVLYDLGKAGSERTVTATAPLSVTLGNAPGVAIAVNGRVLPPPPRVDGAMARFSVGADGQIR